MTTETNNADQPENESVVSSPPVTDATRRRAIFVDKGANVFEQFAHWHRGLPMVAMLETHDDDPDIDRLVSAVVEVMDTLAWMQSELQDGTRLMMLRELGCLESTLRVAMSSQ